MSKSYEAVDKIIYDMRDRAGLGDAWEAMDEAVQEEIREKWARMIARLINDGDAGW
jgi:hypothetical protein